MSGIAHASLPRSCPLFPLRIIVPTITFSPTSLVCPAAHSREAVGKGTMSQETQDQKTPEEASEPQGTPPAKPIPVVVVIGTALILALVIGVVLIYKTRASSSSVFQITRTTPGSVAANGLTTAAQSQGSAPMLNMTRYVDVPPGMVKSEGRGRFELAGLQFLMMHFGPQWEGTDQNQHMIRLPGGPEAKP